jgi:hypothetical protein
MIRPDPVSAPPMAELVFEFTAPRKHDEGGLHRAAARARVSYRLTGAGSSRARVEGPWIDFIAPLGPIEARELAWYLESYPGWPFGTFKDRARKLEASLPRWGRQLFDALPGLADQAQAVRGFRDGKGHPRGQPIERRVTVLVDDRGGDGEAAAMLLALPWELVADERGYLFEGKLRARVRRKLPSTEAMEPAEPRLPLRVLLVLARPEEPGVSFLDPRASALPLMEALEDLGDDVALTVLAEGTVSALRRALEAGEREGRPHQVVHFDGHGGYDRKTGRGQLCFEDTEDAAQGNLERQADWGERGRCGGEPTDGPTRVVARFGETLRTSGADSARALLPEATEVSDELAPILRALQAILAGSRDPTLADDPSLDPADAVELALLLESLSG